MEGEEEKNEKGGEGRWKERDRERDEMEGEEERNEKGGKGR